MNKESTFGFTKGNIKGFFSTPINGLTSGQVALVKTFNENYLHCATAVLENTAAELAGPIISDMVGSYGKAVAFIVHGWVGNA